jgi:hypothetical protein
VAKFRDRQQQECGQIIGASYTLSAAVGLLIAIAMFFGAAPLANEYLHEPRLEAGFKIASALLLLHAINGAQVGILQGFEAYRLLAFGGLLQGAMALLCVLAGAQLFGLQGALLGFLAYSAVSVVLFHILIVRETRERRVAIRWLDIRAILPIFWGFSAPVALMVIAIAPFRWFSETLLARHVSFAELGLFHAAMTMASMLIAAASTLNAPLISLMSNLEAAGGGASRRQYVTLYGTWYAYLAMALPLLLVPQLTLLFFGSSFDKPQYFVALPTLVLYGGLLIYHQGIWRLITLQGPMWFSFGTNIVEGVTLLAAFYLLMQHGAIGLSTAFVLSYVARIGVAVPFLLRRGIASAPLLFDRYFLASLLVLLVLCGWQISGAA